METYSIYFLFTWNLLFICKILYESYLLFSLLMKKKETVICSKIMCKKRPFTQTKYKFFFIGINKPIEFNLENISPFVYTLNTKYSVLKGLNNWVFNNKSQTNSRIKLITTSFVGTILICLYVKDFLFGIFSFYFLVLLVFEIMINPAKTKKDIPKMTGAYEKAAIILDKKEISEESTQSIIKIRILHNGYITYCYRSNYSKIGEKITVKYYEEFPDYVMVKE